MALRLVVHLGGRVLRFPLISGAQTLGSSADCRLMIRHPTISRKHAEIEILDDDRVIITDLNSSNGTHCEGHKLSESTAVKPGMELRFGTLQATIQEISAEDMETGVAISSSVNPKENQTETTLSGQSTIGPAVLELFTLNHLPGIIDTVARGESPTVVAQTVGAALLHCLPCHRVEILQENSGKDALLFSGERLAGDSPAPVSHETGDGYLLRVDFLAQRLAQAYSPVVQSCAGLIRAAARTTTKSKRVPPATGVAPQPPPPPSLVPAVQKIYSQAARIAPSRVSTLIQGESGTGKELLARFIHAASDRNTEPLVTLNCAALPRDLLESELFGVERGVATGVNARAGKFEAAHGGTLFLDEIGDMAAETQARILRVLQEAKVYRIGGHSPHPADVRIISATNRNIDTMLEEGEFRRDLYHRIADWVVELPPLRNRIADIPNLAAFFLKAAVAKNGIQAAGISRAAVSALTSYSWPGNIRELEKEMGRASLFLEDGDLLDTSRLQERILRESNRQGSENSLKAVLEQTERAHINRILRECGGAVTQTAERLGIGTSTLYRRMKELGLE